MEENEGELSYSKTSCMSQVRDLLKSHVPKR